MCAITPTGLYHLRAKIPPTGLFSRPTHRWCMKKIPPMGYFVRKKYPLWGYFSWMRITPTGFSRKKIPPMGVSPWKKYPLWRSFFSTMTQQQHLFLSRSTDSWYFIRYFTNYLSKRCYSSTSISRWRWYFIIYFHSSCALFVIKPPTNRCVCCYF